MSMLLHPGQQLCPRCGGQGCWSCNKTGFRAMCPQCGNSEIMLLTQSGDEFHCQACGYRFMKNGDLVEGAEEEDDDIPSKAPKMARGPRRRR